MIEKNSQKQQTLNFKFEYTKDKRKYTYKEIKIFIGRNFKEWGNVSGIY